MSELKNLIKKYCKGITLIFIILTILLNMLASNFILSSIIVTVFLAGILFMPESAFDD